MTSSVTHRARSMFQFAGYTLDPARGALQLGEREVRLRPKSFAALLYLVENAQRLVTKDELIKAIWPNVVASDESLARCISEVRQAIGDSSRRIIRSVPRRGYRLEPAVHRAARAAEQDRSPISLSLPQRPSIAVLPFEDMGGDVEQQYFADGIAEEIITALSRFSGLFVIARNSSFTYQARPVDVRQVGRELGVRYIIEGSVRKFRNRIRITAQLIDAITGAHLWADRFDGILEDVFDLQDHITARVISAIAPKIEQAEITRAKLKSTERLDAYDCFLRGMELSYQDTKQTVADARRLFLRAIELDAEFAAPYGMAAYCDVLRKASRWSAGQSCDIQETTQLAHTATRLGRDDASVLARAGHALAYVAQDFDAATFAIDRAVALNGNLANAWFASGCLRYWLGDSEASIDHISRFKRLSPLDPLMPVARSASAFAHIFRSEYEDALSEANLALREAPHLHFALRAFTTASALAGNVEQAKKTMSRLRQIDPSLRVCNLQEQTPLRRPEDLAKYADGMRRAGLPD